MRTKAVKLINIEQIKSKDKGTFRKKFSKYVFFHNLFCQSSHSTLRFTCRTTVLGLTWFIFQAALYHAFVSTNWSVGSVRYWHFVFRMAALLYQIKGFLHVFTGKKKTDQLQARPGGLIGLPKHRPFFLQRLTTRRLQLHFIKGFLKRLICVRMYGIMSYYYNLCLMITQMLQMFVKMQK